MVCYVVPTLAALVHGGMRKKVDTLKKNTYQLWLNLMLAGAGTVSIVDHALNGELTLIGPNLAGDLLFGTLITAATVAVWAGMVYIHKAIHRHPVTA